MQLLVGAKRIVEHVDMTDFPLMSQLKINILTDFYLCALQREFDKLGNIISSVDLANLVSTNDKECARILVPKSSTWKSFSTSQKRAKWLFRAVNSVLPVLDNDDEHEEEEPNSDDKKQPD